MSKQEWNVANTFLQQARKEHPDYLQTWMKSTEYAEHQGDLKQATIYNEKARQCESDRPAPFIQYAELAMHAKLWEQALERWQELRSRFPDIPAGY